MNTDDLHDLLHHPYQADWSYQGLGMLRLKFGTARLHLWLPERAVPNVSPVHDHPWDFHSLVVAGAMRNETWLLRASNLPAPSSPEDPRFWKEVRIQCGEGGGPLHDPTWAQLDPHEDHTYRAGEVYRLEHDVLHRSTPEPGTITWIKRVIRPDPDHAHVYWQGPGPYVSAEPRPATREEIDAFTYAALQRLREVR